MRKTLAYILTAVFAVGLVLTVEASVKKREPDRRDVAKIMAKIGGDHFPEGIEVDDLGRVDTGFDDDENGGVLAYFWIFVGELPDDGGYYLIICDNSPEPHYLGYYPVKNEPIECGERYIAFQVEDTGGDPDPLTGRTDTKSIRLTETGPQKRITLPSPNGSPSEFVEAPSLEEVEEQVKAEREASAQEQSSSGTRTAPKKMKPEYRSWKVNYGGRMITIESAIFVNFKNGQVTLKNAKNGQTATIALRDFSDADQKYLKELLK